MRQFSDKDGRKWSVAIDTATIKRVRNLTDFDLLKIVEDEGKPLYELRDNVVLLVDVVYAICKPEADSANISDEAFGRAMGGDALEHAWDAVITEMIAFFPTGRRRILARAAILAGLSKLLDEKTKLEALGLPPPQSGANCSRWRAVSACCRGLSRLASFGRWMKPTTISRHGSPLV